MENNKQLQKRERYLRDAKFKALSSVPTYRTEMGPDGTTHIKLTATEKLDAAEIIYQWLIKGV